ncbi:hypothetical protein PanWU01x14_203770 [Parasponia andersonii]|uniref:Uncharacterized protein n=1 Tax=Parasponia andersonii TaxID=3476 RepID=A0A2P5BWT3_PARAD|nr:hypothetical protein PanWU01x14_203770 [Parasponia andersonii]
MEVVSPILMQSPSLRSTGTSGSSASSLRKEPLEESRSRSIHFPDSDQMEMCLEEMPASLMVKLLPRTTRPIRMVDPGGYSRLSPSRGPLFMTSFRAMAPISESDRL